MSQSVKPTHSSSEPSSDGHKLDLQKQLQWILPLTAVVLVVTMGIQWRRGQEVSRRNEVILAYSEADSAEALSAVAEAFPGEPEAPLARLQAAALLFNEGDYEGAKKHYGLFVSEFRRHPLRSQADWGLWMSEEALGNLEAAMEGFSSVGSESMHYPQALLGRARILEKQGSAQEAVEIYDKLIEAFPDSAWAEQARVFRDRLLAQAD